MKPKYSHVTGQNKIIVNLCVFNVTNSFDLKKKTQKKQTIFTFKIHKQKLLFNFVSILHQNTVIKVELNKIFNELHFRTFTDCIDLL